MVSLQPPGVSSWFAEPSKGEKLPECLIWSHGWLPRAPPTQVAPSQKRSCQRRARSDAPKPGREPPRGSEGLGRCRLRLVTGERVAWPYMPEDLGGHYDDPLGELLVVELAGPDGKPSWLDDRTVDQVLVGQGKLVPLEQLREAVQDLVPLSGQVSRNLYSELNRRCRPLSGSKLMVTVLRVTDVLEREAPAGESTPPD